MNLVLIVLAMFGSVVVVTVVPLLILLGFSECLITYRSNKKPR